MLFKKLNTTATCTDGGVKMSKMYNIYSKLYLPVTQTD